ncbi:MauE/DoxX family redox-associated membrane protein [Desulfovibrio ferrophilus]|uniref:DoxX family protein n=1 Tax=Desulfovibrio ferrophilus TaxID=241368 RepID=A0A2Z6AXF4_9BACT|nr:MauE/DoxX family redox-associated membrane protein [Desulfovibrio ferrophilus]BBD07934.1 DoxX family protein [Desulfovibrio ferrophilus]
MTWLTAILRIGFGLVFMAAGVSKIIHPVDFSQVIYNYQMVPDLLVNPMAIILPWVEVVCGAALVTNCFARGASFILSFLLLIFLGALWFNISRGLDVGCGCFTADPQAKGNLMHSAIRDTILFSVGLIVLWRAFVDAASQQASARFWRELKAPPVSRKKSNDLLDYVPPEPTIRNGTLVVGMAAQSAQPDIGSDIISPVPLPGDDGVDDSNAEGTPQDKPVEGT